LSPQSVGVTIQLIAKSEEEEMQQNNAKLGGILSIVAGAMGCVSALGAIIFAIFLVLVNNGQFVYDGYYSPDDFFNVLMVVYIICGVIGIIVSVLAIVGGIFALRKKNWGLALAGSIAGVLAFFPCGVVAVIFTAMSKPEFNMAPPPAV
jgi:hypothetical protein